MQNMWYVAPKLLNVASTSRAFCDPRERSDVTGKQELVAENGERDVSSAAAWAPAPLFWP